jgi:hypothetical protein
VAGPLVVHDARKSSDVVRWDHLSVAFRLNDELAAMHSIAI